VKKFLLSRSHGITTEGLYCSRSRFYRGNCFSSDYRSRGFPTVIPRYFTVPVFVQNSTLDGTIRLQVRRIRRLARTCSDLQYMGRIVLLLSDSCSYR